MQQCILSIRETLQEILGRDPGIPRQGRQPSTFDGHWHDQRMERQNGRDVDRFGALIQRGRTLRRLFTELHL